VKLINRRFVALAFDLAPMKLEGQGVSIGAMSDPDARRFTLEADPDLEGDAVDTPPVLIATWNGDVVGRISNYATEDEFLRELVDVLAGHPEWNDDRDLKAKSSEAAARPDDVAAQLDLISLRMEVGQLDRALGELGRLLLRCRDDRDRRLVLRQMMHAGWITQNLAVVDSAMKKLDPKEIAGDADLELEWAHVLALRKDFAGAKAKAAAALSSSSPSRKSEAAYVVAVAQFGLGEIEQAKQTLRNVIETGPEGPWVYRADWGLSSIENPTKHSWTTADPKTALGRIGYMGRLDPDFAGRTTSTPIDVEK
jgi:tetratricopeptide (TPR) repeat protein